MLRETILGLFGKKVQVKLNSIDKQFIEFNQEQFELGNENNDQELIQLLLEDMRYGVGGG